MDACLWNSKSSSDLFSIKHLYNIYNILHIINCRPRNSFSRGNFNGTRAQWNWLMLLFSLHTYSSSTALFSVACKDPALLSAVCANKLLNYFSAFGIAANGLRESTEVAIAATRLCWEDLTGLCIAAGPVWTPRWIQQWNDSLVIASWFYLLFDVINVAKWLW